MQRQKSLFSFFQKPSPGTQKDTGGKVKAPGASQLLSEKKTQNGGSSLEVSGTETPLEKVPRKVLPQSFAANDETGSSSTLFSNIMHKFVRVDDKENATQRKQACKNSSDVRELPKEEVTTQATERDKVSNINSDVDLGPDTPATRPAVSCLKRNQDDFPMFGDKKDSSSLDSCKKIKLLQESLVENKNYKDNIDVASKFEWLDPSRIKDANGRRPGDPLYDKTTLHIPPDALKKMSASQKQYWTVKCQYMDVLLFFKVGKFYELYEVDAEIGHKELDWKITVSGVGKCRQVGISESGIDEAVQKLVARGYKVGRMEQLETSEQAKARGAHSVIQRKLVQVTTPSTTIDGNMGPDAVHLIAIKEGNNVMENGSTVYGFAFVDCAALKFWVGSICDDATCAGLGALLMQVSPKEVIYESRALSREALKALNKYSFTGSKAVQLSPVHSVINFLDASEVKNMINLNRYFKGSPNSLINALDGVMHHGVALCALGGLVSHLSRLMLDDILQGGDILPYQVYHGCLRIDGQTLVNLEIFCNSADGGSSGTLYQFLDNCLTSSGKRLLRSWICHPLKDIDSINNRLDVVEKLMSQLEIMLLIAQNLRKLPDLERLFGRVKASSQSSASLVIPMIGKKLLKQSVKAFGTLVKGLRIGIDLLRLLQEGADIASLLSKVYKLPMLSGTNGLDEFLTQFEVAIDSDFPNYENHDLTDTDAETLLILVELFNEKATQWSEVIYALNCIDVLRSFAVTASTSSRAMARPVVLPKSKSMSLSQEIGGSILKVKGLWHPFALGENDGLPVPNDVFLGEDLNDYHPRALLLTGPNMGGKSTLLRATCLAVILAQLGSYVPCETCVLSLVDIIFTRLGATDRIMTGENNLSEGHALHFSVATSDCAIFLGTFLVECTETASILQNATQDSLVLLDELGRGTSTFDGYAIAYAVFRHLIEKVHCRLLFATHYHPLTKEFGSHPRVTLKHMACSFTLKSESFSKAEQELVFLYQLTDGACPESYGLQVAIMAGISEQVVEAAKQAAKVMKRSIAESFKSSEQRSEFSTLHEEWLKTLVNVSQPGNGNLNEGDPYNIDTLFCLWHELKSSYH